MTTVCLILSLLAVDDIAARMVTLERHFERLQAIVVPADLAAERAERVDAVRALLDAGAESAEDVNGLYQQMDALRWWLWQNAEARPEMPPGEFLETPASWTVETPALTLAVNREDFGMTVSTADGAVWTFEPCDERDIRAGMKGAGFLSAGRRTAVPFRTGYSTGMLITLAAFPDREGLEIVLGLHVEGDTLRCSVTAPGDTHDFDQVAWPKPLVAGTAPEDASVIPLMQGMLLPGDYPQAITREELAHSRTLYMPWWGQIRDGHGVLTILETPDDAGVRYDHPSGGPTRVEPLWFSSMRRVRYQRWVRYEFHAEATYVSLAKAYRRHVKERGQFVSLREKLARNPALGAVIGRPVVHIGALYHYVPESSYYNKERQEANHQLQTFAAIAEQLRTLHKTGLSAYVHLDGWGYLGYDNAHPDVVPAGTIQGGWDGLREVADVCREFGWVFAVHDQYRDFYKTAVSFDYQLAKQLAGGGYEEGATWCGGPQSILSPVHAPGYVRRNHDEFARHGIDVRGAYLDVFAVVPLEESYHPHHPVTRSECFEYRRQCFELLRARGYVMSSEEPIDRFVPVLDLVHHGPYFVFNEEKRAGIPVPLFELVYHDSILLPWSMSDASDWGIPEGDIGRLHCLLNAGMPYTGTNPGEEQVARVREAAQLAEHCAHLEMVNHEFLDETLRKQRATYAGGTTVTVDFDSGEYDIDYGAGDSQ